MSGTSSTSGKCRAPYVGLRYLASSTQWPPMSIQRAAKKSRTTDHCESNADDTRRLLLRNLLQQQKSVRNHAKMQLQQNAQHTWLQVSQTMMLFLVLECYYQTLLLMSVRKKAYERKRNTWTRRRTEERDNHGACQYRSLVIKRKINKQQLTNQRSAFSATRCTD